MTFRSDTNYVIIFASRHNSSPLIVYPDNGDECHIPPATTGKLKIQIQKSPNKPSTTKLGIYKDVEIKQISISDELMAELEDIPQLKNFDRMLYNEVSNNFVNVKQVWLNNQFTNNKIRTLQIIPTLNELRLHNTATLFLVGSLAGKSYVLIDVVFKDSLTGEIIAKPQFRTVANAEQNLWRQVDEVKRLFEYSTWEIGEYCRNNL